MEKAWQGADRQSQRKEGVFKERSKCDLYENYQKFAVHKCAGVQEHAHMMLLA